MKEWNDYTKQIFGSEFKLLWYVFHFLIRSRESKGWGMIVLGSRDMNHGILFYCKARKSQAFRINITWDSCPNTELYKEKNQRASVGGFVG